MRKVKRTSLRTTSLEQVEVEKVLVVHAQIPLNYHARQALLERIALRYRAASLIQKRLLLDRFVEITGSARKSAIRLLNHPLQGSGIIQRSRLPLYGPEVQQARFLVVLQKSCHRRKSCVTAQTVLSSAVSASR